MSYLLGIDVGGTTIEAAVASPDCEIRGRAGASTPKDTPATSVPRTLRRLVEAACEDAGVAVEAIAAAGVGSIGPFDRDDGVIAAPANLPGDEAVPIVGPLRDLLSTDRIVLRNDAIAAVVGEREFADAAAANMVYLTISTGIGAGVVVDGSVLSGTYGNAGEVGHMTIDPEGRMDCRCGHPGHWEAYCGGANVPRYAAHLARECDVETDLPLDDDGFSAADVFDRADSDDLAAMTVERIGRWNAIGVANVVQAYAPAYVAVGGAVARNNPEAVVDPIRRRLPDHVMIEVPEVGVTELGADAVIYGALVCARESGAPQSRP